MLKTYDPSEVSVAFGASLLTGWNTVRPSRAEDGAMFSVGTSGEITRSLNANKLGTITLTYPQASAENLILSGYEASKITVPITIIDKSGKTVCIMKFGTVVKPPDSDLGKEAGTREWAITGEMPVMVIGGNNPET